VTGKLPTFEKFVQQVAGALVDTPTPRMREKLGALIQQREHLRAEDKALVADALRGILQRLEDWIRKLER
jgi:hypothetical protein